MREHNYYRVKAISPDEMHEFKVHYSGTLRYTVVVSDEISALLEDRFTDEAIELRAHLTSLFLTHLNAINAATENRTDYVEVYVP